MNTNENERNPNAGYITKNQYGLFGKVPVTPQLLAHIQQTGFVTVSVSPPQQHTKDGDTWVSSYVGLKPYTPKQPTAQPAQYAQAAPQYAQAAPAPVQPAPAAQASPGVQVIEQGGDEIPW